MSLPQELALSYGEMAPVEQWNFVTQGSLPSWITLTRGSSGTYFAPTTGYLTSATTNTARFDYPNITSQGLLLEGSATNLALQSDTFTTTWTTGNITLAENVAGVDNTTSAWTITDNSTNGLHRLYAAVSSTTGYSLQLIAKAGTGTVTYIDLSTTGTGAVYASFNLSTGVIGNMVGVTTAYSSYLGNGFYKFVITNTTSAGGFIHISLQQSSTTPSGYVGSGSTVIIQDAQIELNSVASSYIATTTGTVTRSADVPAVPAACANGPTILEYTTEGTNATQRKIYAAGAFAWPSGIWARSIAVYPPNTPKSYLNAHLQVNGPY